MNVSAVCLPPLNLNDFDQHAGRDAAIMGWGPESIIQHSHLFFQKTIVSCNYLTHLISAQGAPSTALRQRKVKIGKLATCMVNMGISSVVFSTQNICIVPHGSLPNKSTCMVRK